MEAVYSDFKKFVFPHAASSGSCKEDATAEANAAPVLFPIAPQFPAPSPQPQMTARLDSGDLTLSRVLCDFLLCLTPLEPLWEFSGVTPSTDGEMEAEGSQGLVTLSNRLYSKHASRATTRSSL